MQMQIQRQIQVQVQKQLMIAMLSRRHGAVAETTHAAGLSIHAETKPRMA
jgi:hypothetical protein